MRDGPLRKRGSTVGATARTGDRRRSRVPAALTVLALVVGAAFGGGATALAQAGGDPYRAEQWNLETLRVDEAWTAARGAGVVVAVVDTGVALDHPDLFDRVVKRPDGSVIGLDLVDDDRDPSDRHGHGTLVAGVIAATADDGSGIAGVAPEVGILPVRVLDADGSGTAEDVGRGIRWAVDEGADVINLSLEASASGASDGPGVPADAVRYADDHGVLVIAAAGNRPGAAAAYPEDSPIVLVGAVDRDDRRAGPSSVGRDDGFVAPGVDILSTWCRRTSDGCDVAAAPYGVADGTSFAAPHVAGVAALLVSAGFDAAQARQRLAAGAVDLGRPGPDTDYGSGRVDAAASLGVSTEVARSDTAASEATARGASMEPDPVAPDPVAPDPPSTPEEPPPPPQGPAQGTAGAPEQVDVGVPSRDPEPFLVGGQAYDGAAAPTPGADVGGTELVSLEAGAESEGAPFAGSGLWWRSIAAMLLTIAMVCWSAVARAAT
jgi:subtilisin family serine protease